MKIWINEEIENILNSVVTSTEIDDLHTTATNTDSDSVESLRILISLIWTVLITVIL